MLITDVDKKILEAISYIEMTIDKVEEGIQNYPEYPIEISHGMKPTNYYKSAFYLAELRQSLMNLKTVNRLYKINDDFKSSLFQSYLNEEKPSPIVITETYKITDIDTWETISIKYSIDWKVIADYNAMDSTDLVAGTEIKIQRIFDPKLIEDLQRLELPIFDTPDNENVFGRDLPNYLSVNSAGDLEVLNNRATFVQGMQNIIDTELGALPFYPTFGLDVWIGDDIPRDISEDWLKQRIQESFLRDPRVSEVPLDKIELTIGTESMTFTIHVYPIQGLDFQTITGETQIY